MPSFQDREVLQIRRTPKGPGATPRKTNPHRQANKEKPRSAALTGVSCFKAWRVTRLNIPVSPSDPASGILPPALAGLRHAV